MSDYGSESEQEEVMDLPIVDIPGQQDKSRRRSLRRDSPGRSSPWESDSNEDDYFDSDDEPRSARESMRRGQAKNVNGKRGYYMEPPDKVLLLRQKKAAQLIKKKRVNLAIKELIRCTALARIVYGNNHWRFAESHANLAEAYLKLKDGYVAQGLYHSEIARDAIMKGVHTSTQEEKSAIYGTLIKIYYIMGQSYSGMKKYPEAEDSLNKANKLAKEVSKFSSSDRHKSQENELKISLAFARLYARQKKFANADSQYETCLDLMTEVYGPEGPELIPVYQEQGRLEQAKGRHANHDRAIELYLQAHSIAGAIHKEGSVELVDTALAVARAYAATGKEEAETSAESYLTECETTCKVVYGPQSAKTLEVQDELARLYIRTQRQDVALDILRTSLEHKSEFYGEYSEEVSDTYKLMASIHLSQGNIEKALRSYKKCLNIESLVLGKNHRKPKDTQRTMDILMASPGLSKKFVLSKQDELKNRPRFNSIVNRNQTV